MLDANNNRNHLPLPGLFDITNSIIFQSLVSLLVNKNALIGLVRYADISAAASSCSR